MDCGCGVSVIDDVIYCPMHKAAPDMLEALKKAPRPMDLITARELKANWRAVDHWFAVYDAWMDDVAKQALAEAGK